MEIEVTEVNRTYNHSIEECDISTAVRRVYSRDVHRMSYLFGRNSSIAAQRDEVRACLRRDPTSVSISWMVQPKLVNGVYVFSKYYESSSFLHSIDDYLCLEISLILRETCENTMGFFIQSKNLEKGISLSMHVDFIMKKKEESNTYLSFHKTKTEHFILDSLNSYRGIFQFCDMEQLNSFVTHNHFIPHVIFSVKITDITTRYSRRKHYIKT